MRSGQRNTLGWYERLHMRHRRLRYVLKSERPSLALLRSLDLKGKTLVDIGANRGIYSWIMSECAGPDGRVFAFEPQPELGEHLESLKLDFGLGNLSIVGQGLSSQPATLKMQRSRVGAGQASMSLPPGTYDEIIEVPVTTLDRFVADLDPDNIGFIKIDVEGHETEVFKGATQVLKTYRPLLLFELTDNEADRGEIFAILEELGYDGWFYCVSPDDHKSIFRNGQGIYYPANERVNHPHVKEGVDMRNYFFAPREHDINARIKQLERRKLKSAALPGIPAGDMATG